MIRRSASELQIIKHTSKYLVDILMENSYGYGKESYFFEHVKFLANQKKQNLSNFRTMERQLHFFCDPLT
jgi:hypothetical protein